MQNNKKGPREGSMKARTGFDGQGKVRDLPALGEKPKALRGETKPKTNSKNKEEEEYEFKNEIDICDYHVYACNCNSGNRSACRPDPVDQYGRDDKL